ncbi:MAG: hypothetical protein WC344_03930 [Bacilli bacterium]|jgi:hypothetical protein
MKITDAIDNYLLQEKPKLIILKNLHHDLCPDSDYASFRKVFSRLEKRGEVKEISKGIHLYLKGENDIFTNGYFIGNRNGFLLDEEYLKTYNLDEVLNVKPTIYSNKVIGNSFTMQDGTIVKYYDYDPTFDSATLFTILYLFDVLNSSYILEAHKERLIASYNDEAATKVIRYLNLSRLKRVMLKNRLDSLSISNNIELIISEIS